MGRGGARKGAGRKPGAFTLLRNRVEAERVDDAEYAFTLYASVMRDDKQPLELRLECADWVENRVLGKPKEKQEQSGEMVIRIVREGSKPIPPDAAPGAGANQG